MTHPNAHCYLSNVSCTLENVLRGVKKRTFFFSEYYRNDRTDVMMKVQWRKMPT